MKSLRGKTTRDSLAVDTEGSWAISYGDMVTLLLAFFILFFSVDPKERDNRMLSESLLAKIFSLQSGEQPRPASVAGDKKNPETDNALNREVVKWGGRVEKQGGRLFVEFPDSSFFASAGLDVLPEGIKLLKDFGVVYTPYAGSHILNILAFTDDTPVRRVVGRPFRDNLELSVLRAVAGERLLQEAGIPLARMRVSGFGVKSAPVGATHDESERFIKNWRIAQARKIVLVIEPDMQ